MNLGKTLKIFIVILLFVGSSAVIAVNSENKLENFKRTEVGATASPTYSNVGTSTTVPSQSCRFYSYWTSDEPDDLDTCLFSTNNTGRWQANETVWSNAGVTGKWANVTKELDERNFPGTVVGYQFWANDTSGNWNTTGILTLTTTPVVYVYPSIVSAGVDDTFTISVVVEDLTDARILDPWYPPSTLQLGTLYGFDIQFKWDPAILEYVDHTVTVPVEDYPDPISGSPYPGILHEDILEFKEIVDEDNNITGAQPGTMAWFTYMSIYPAPAFNGDGTFFTMMFRVKTEDACKLELVWVSLTDETATPMLFDTEDGIFLSSSSPTADFTFSPEVGLVDSPMSFDASASSDPPPGHISKYIWDFGDGNTTEVVGNPEVSHSYDEAAGYTVSLTVEDNEGVRSIAVSRTVKIIGSKNVKVTSVSFSTLEARYVKVRVNKTFEIRAKIKNDGDVDETCTVIASYNATPVDWDNFSATEWTEISRKSVFLPKSMPGPIPVDFYWNTTDVPKLETQYYALINITGVQQEENVEDNIKVSTDSVLITTKRCYDVAAEDLDFGWGSAFSHLVIDGEETRFRITVWNKGTEDEDSINVTLIRNGTIQRSWNVSLAFGGLTQKLIDETLEPGYYNITALATIENDEDPTDNRQEGILHVIGSLQLNFTYSPEKPLVGEPVGFDASASFHLDGYISKYIWNFGDGNTTEVVGNPEVSHSYDEAGDYTVSLTVEDNYGITYTTTRDATDSYMITAAIQVESPTGFPIEYILLLILAIIAVLAVVLYRRRQAKT